MKAKISLGISAAIIIGVIASSIFYNTSPGNTNNIVGTSSNVLRIGYFPNLNHAQAVIGLNNGDFQKALGKGNITLQTSECRTISN